MHFGLSIGFIFYCRENLFDSVLDEIFVTILHDYAEQRINSGHSITRNEKDVFKRGEVENDGDRFINERIKVAYIHIYVLSIMCICMYIYICIIYI